MIDAGASTQPEIISTLVVIRFRERFAEDDLSVPNYH
jgi:hypothetical protein